MELADFIEDASKECRAAEAEGERTISLALRGITAVRRSE